MMSTHHPRSRQGTRDQVEDQALECTNSSKTQRKNSKSCSRGSGLPPPKFSPLPWVSLHFHSGFSFIQSPTPTPRLPTALPHTRLGSPLSEACTTFLEGSKNTFRRRLLILPDVQSGLELPSTTAHLFGCSLSNSSLLPQHHRGEMDGPRKDSVYKVKCKSKNIES